ncbi:hypothetical protein CH063_12967 [Colletotrichum higginsianum]|uniref:Tat pathway signal sequence n=1 Tax=Colletotrichum higginsianum (strain IMI 349063) TaxID=759273 RepID=H1VSJ2_COLHI|nr:Tat pathway signal sequence [Colletotrichum higginsianum IMI 349063]OBR08158.1 Tat pathway signal sequence [Colletotrichum higginsianum IMI 349063]CCF43200.1 hypothetical protein CH063_12967 [Colletotrichum higginsianum]
MQSQQDSCDLDRPFSPEEELEKSSMHRSSSAPDSESSSFLSEREIREIRSNHDSRRRRWWWWVSFGLVHAVLLSVYIGSLLSLRAQVSKLRKYGPQLVNSPANDGVEWELQTFINNNNEHGPFSGPPREELDENIVLEPDYMKKLGRDRFGVAVPDGSGFIGTLNVYHELHCIKRLYQYTYPEVYPQGDTPAEQASSRQHKDHCLDFLRQSAMCHADVGVITFQWSPNSLLPVANATHHQCANWDKLAQWTKARTVDMMKPGWLVHPSKGPAYPNGKDYHH